MVIVRLTGGLGNQLFQYALGRRMAYSNGCPLKLDVSVFANDVRSYRLHHFNTVQQFASNAEIRRLAGAPGKGVAGRIVRRIRRQFSLQPRRVVTERGHRFDPQVLSRKGAIYLDGYWQSEKYFADIDHVLRKELTLKAASDPTSCAVSDAINRCESVSLHIRRGDYASNPVYNQFHGLCRVEYYDRAVEQIAAAVEKPHFFVFSDDPDWARLNLRLDYAITFVDHNREDRDYEDMRLMSQCNHHIIANSSFSWWGAWLCCNPDKIVIAPKKWFNDPTVDTADLIRESWTRI